MQFNDYQDNQNLNQETEAELSTQQEQPSQTQSGQSKPSPTQPTKQQTDGSSDPELEDKYRKVQNQYLRMYADFENYKRAQADQLDQQVRKTKRNLLGGVVLSTIDNLYRTVEFAPSTEDPKLQKYFKTIEMTLQKAIQEVNQAGAQILLPKIGDPFDPEAMEAIQTEKSDDQLPAHAVTKIVSLGLKIDGLVLQPAKVVLKEE